ncbi:MAG TPA: hypothetical protein VE077_07825, partial [Candidatus Methylomirabilis sp.]|nr:hypothetical protein [Candidatus Methylomirabilis sp.]
MTPFVFSSIVACAEKQQLLSMDNSRRFLDSPLWKQLAEKHDSVALADLQKAALALTENDLGGLVQRLQSGSTKEQYAALGMLLAAVRGNNGFLGPLLGELRERARQLAKGWVIEDAQSSDPAEVARRVRALMNRDLPLDVGFRAYSLLTEVDPEAAAQFLISHFDYTALSTYQREQLLHRFAELCTGEKSKWSDTAMRRLADVAGKNEPEAKKAAQYLIGRQIMRRTEVEKLTESWRTATPDELEPAAVSEFVALHPRFAGREEELIKQATAWRKTKSVAA